MSVYLQNFTEQTGLQQTYTESQTTQRTTPLDKIFTLVNILDRPLIKNTLKQQTHPYFSRETHKMIDSPMFRYRFNKATKGEYRELTELLENPENKRILKNVLYLIEHYGFGKINEDEILKDGIYQETMQILREDLLYNLMEKELSNELSEPNLVILYLKSAPHLYNLNEEERELVMQSGIERALKKESNKKINNLYLETKAICFSTNIRIALIQERKIRRQL